MAASARMIALATSEELDAVSGGSPRVEDKEQADALKIFAQVLQKAGQV